MGDDKPKPELDAEGEGLLAGLSIHDYCRNPYIVHSYFDPWPYERKMWQSGFERGRKLRQLLYDSGEEA